MTTYFRNLLLTSETPNGATPPAFDPLPDVEIPAEGDWTDHGPVILKGTAGQWDLRLDGMISPCAVVKIGSTFHVYYIGADGDRGDGGPANRKLGVATSTTGISGFTKFAGNPILTHAVGISNCDECGIFSACAFFHSDNEVKMYYGGMEELTPGSVDGDILLATSTDGFSFTERGTVWSNQDSGIDPSENEIYPIAAFEEMGTWYVYFLEYSGFYDLWLVQGIAQDAMVSDQELLTSLDFIGGGGLIRKNGSDNLLPCTISFANYNTQMRSGLRSTPETLTTVEQTYAFGETVNQHRVIYLDRSTSTWLMYYRNPTDQDIYAKSAPMVLA